MTSKENFYLGYKIKEDYIEYYYNNPDWDYGGETVTIEVFPDKSANVVLSAHGVNLDFLKNVLKHLDKELENE